MNIFLSLVKAYLVSHPEVVHRLANVVVHAVVEHVSPSPALGGEASASPVGSSPVVGAFSGQDRRL